MLLLVRFRQMISWILSFIIRFKYQQTDLKSNSNINMILDPDYFLFWIRISSTFGSRLLLILDPDFFCFWIQISSVLNPDFFCFWIQISSDFESRFHAEGSCRVYCSSPRSSWLSAKQKVSAYSSRLLCSSEERWEILVQKVSAYSSRLWLLIKDEKFSAKNSDRLSRRSSEGSQVEWQWREREGSGLMKI